MATEGFEPLQQEELRGLVTLPSAYDVPPGRSTFCQNMDFVPGSVKKRDGTTRFTNALSATKIVSMKEYVMLDSDQRRILILTDEGALYKESGGETYTLIADDFVETTLKTNLRMNSTTLFGREYMAFAGNNEAGISKPRQYDDTNLDPVAPEGPGWGPTVAAGAGAGPDTAVTAGVHKFRIFFRTRTGHWSALSPATEFTAAGNALVNLTNIPVGPAWVTERVICATPEGSDDYYFIENSNMVVGNNTTSTANGIGWGPDSVLIAGTAVSSQADTDGDMRQLTVLPAQAGVVAFKGRLGWWGERATILRANDQGFLNLSFNGGVTTGAPNVPCGWTDAGLGGGTVGVLAGSVGPAYSITGNGVGQRGAITNKATSFGALPAGVAIRARLRLKRSVGAAAGTVHLLLCSASTPIGDVTATTGMSVPVASISSTEWRVLNAQILSAADNLPDVTWELRYSGGAGAGKGTPITNGEWIACDEIEIYPASDPDLKSHIRWSRVDEPESYDDLNGRQLIAENNGQDVRVAFVLRDTCYAVKDHSTFALRDNPDTEPAGWGATEVSNKIGTTAPQGIGFGDEWIAMATREGLYYFDGASWSNLSIEITPTWQRINWKYDYQITVRVDVENKRIFVGAPIDGATWPNQTFYLKYWQDAPTNPDTRDWSLWTLPIEAATYSQRPDGTRRMVFAAGGELVYLNSSATDETEVAGVGAAISAYYQTHYFGEPYGRQLFGYMTANIVGNGWLRAEGVPQDAVLNKQLPDTVLNSVTGYDKEWMLAFTAERAAFKFYVTSRKERFTIRRLNIFAKQSPWHGIRGRVS